MKMNIIRNKMGKKVVAALMAVMIMSAPVTSVSFADEAEAGDAAASQTTTEQAAPAPKQEAPKSEAPAPKQEAPKQEAPKSEAPAPKQAAPKSEAPKPAAPEKPEATSHEDNGRIEEYNKKVDEYNEAAKQHNESVDKEYEAAVEETNRMNEEIDRHNASEQQRVKDAEERNARAQEAADEENRKIDEENAAEKDRVDRVNKEEAEKEQASRDARAAAEAQNKETEEHNAKVEKYNADMEQYAKDLAQYEYDRKIEAQILKLGYGSVEQYNDAINKAYNTPAKKSVEKNAAAEKVTVKDTYTVQEAAEKSGRMVTVHIEHNFQDIGLSYTEDFEIDANDVITFSPLCAVCESTSPGYATFYYNTDDQHQMGYWMEAYSSVGSNARYSQSDWNCGDTHEISYKDGKNHAFDKEEIVVEYNYMWNPLKIYKTYNTPVEPSEPENPGEARSFVDIPELYAANYETYVERQHVTAELEEIGEAVLWDRIADPVKKAHLSLADYMTLFDVPEATEAAPAPAPAEAAAPAAPAETAAPAVPAEAKTPAEQIASASKALLAVKKAAPAAAGTTIANGGMPLTAANAEMVSDNAVPMNILDSSTPQAPFGAWALINLLCALATALLSLIMMIRYFGARREENEETGEITERNRRGALRLASLIPAIGAIAAFLLTENMANPMVLADGWTLMMVIFLAIQTGVAVMAAKKDSDSEEDVETA